MTLTCISKSIIFSNWKHCYGIPAAIITDFLSSFVKCYVSNCLFYAKKHIIIITIFTLTTENQGLPERSSAHAPEFMFPVRWKALCFQAFWRWESCCWGNEQMAFEFGTSLASNSGHGQASKHRAALAGKANDDEPRLFLASWLGRIFAKKTSKKIQRSWKRAF